MEAWKRYIRRDDSHLVDLFVGQLKSTLRCTHCAHESVTFEPFWDLSLGIPARTGDVSLTECFDAFTKEETLDGDEMPVSERFLRPAHPLIPFSSELRGLQDKEEEHQEIFALSSSQDSGGSLEEIFPHREIPTEAELHCVLPPDRAEPLPLHGQRDLQQLQLLRHQQPQRNPLQRTLHGIRQASN